MKDNKPFSQLNQNYVYNSKLSDNSVIEEEKYQNNDMKLLDSSKGHKRKNNQKEFFPLIEGTNGTKKIPKKNVKANKMSNKSKSSPKNIIIKIEEKNVSKSKNLEKIDLNTNTEIPLLFDNNDSSSFENNKNNTIHTNINTNNHYINSYFNKSIYACKNKKNNNNDSQSLNDVFKKLLDIKHKIRGIENQKKNRITQFKSNLSVQKNPTKISIKINDINNISGNPNNYNYNTRNKRSKSYHAHFSTFNPSPKKINQKVLRPNINIVNFKKSASSYRRFNEHIKYILHIRESEMSSLAEQFHKALEDNEKEKDYHYKHRIFPLEIIEKLNKIKEDLTMNKYKNEYIKRMDRYDIQPLKKFLNNEKKNVSVNRGKIFKGIFSKFAKKIKMTK